MEKFIQYIIPTLKLVNTIVTNSNKVSLYNTSLNLLQLSSTITIQKLLLSVNLKLSLNSEFYIGNGLFLLFSLMFSFFFYGFLEVNGGLNHPWPFVANPCVVGAWGMCSS